MEKEGFSFPLVFCGGRIYPTLTAIATVIMRVLVERIVSPHNNPTIHLYVNRMKTRLSSHIR